MTGRTEAHTKKYQSEVLRGLENTLVPVNYICMRSRQYCTYKNRFKLGLDVIKL